MATLQAAQAALEEQFEKANALSAQAADLQNQATAIVVAALKAASEAAGALDEGGDDNEDNDGDTLCVVAQDRANDYAYSNGLEFDGDLSAPGFWESSTC